MDGARLEIVRFAHEHLDGAMEIFAEERWAYAEDRERAWRALTAAGSLTLVAIEDGRVLGLAQTIGDGEIQTFLAALIVARARRRDGIGRELVAASLEQTTGLRLDLISEADGFYEELGFTRMSGFRLRR